MQLYLSLFTSFGLTYCVCLDKYWWIFVLSNPFKSFLWSTSIILLSDTCFMVYYEYYDSFDLFNYLSASNCVSIYHPKKKEKKASRVSAAGFHEHHRPRGAAAPSVVIVALLQLKGSRTWLHPGSTFFQDLITIIQFTLGTQTYFISCFQAFFKRIIVKRLNGLGGLAVCSVTSVCFSGLTWRRRTFPQWGPGIVGKTTGSHKSEAGGGSVFSELSVSRLLFINQDEPWPNKRGVGEARANSWTVWSPIVTHSGLGLIQTCD